MRLCGSPWVGCGSESLVATEVPSPPAPTRADGDGCQLVPQAEDQEIIVTVGSCDLSLNLAAGTVEYVADPGCYLYLTGDPEPPRLLIWPHNTESADNKSVVADGTVVKPGDIITSGTDFVDSRRALAFDNPCTTLYPKGVIVHGVALSPIQSANAQNDQAFGSRKVGALAPGGGMESQ